MPAQISRRLQQAQPGSALLVPNRNVAPSVLEDNHAYNNYYALAYTDLDITKIAPKAVSATRNSSEYFSVIQSGSAQVTIPVHNTGFLVYCPLVQGTTWTPQPILFTTAASTSTVGALPAWQSIAGAYAPNNLTAALPGQIDVIDNTKDYAFQKGFMAVDVASGLQTDYPPAIQAIGLADLDIKPAHHGDSLPTAAAAADWNNSTLNIMVCPAIELIPPATVVLTDHAASRVSPQTGRAAIVWGQPTVERSQGTSFYPGYDAASLAGVAASDLLGYATATRWAQPHIVITNRGTTDLVVRVITKTVYAVPMTYYSCNALPLYRHLEVSGPRLDARLAIALSRGGVGTDILNSASALAEAVRTVHHKGQKESVDNVRARVADRKSVV